MTTDSQLPDRLLQLGEALDRATRADLAEPGLLRGRHRPRLAHANDNENQNHYRFGSSQKWASRLVRAPRRLVIAAVVTVVAVPAAAIAATELISTGQVAASLPQGTKALIGTDPTCTVVQANVEYHCVLASAPSNDNGTPTTSPGGGVSSFHATGNTAIVKLKDGKLFVVKADSAEALKQRTTALLQKAGGGTSTTLSAPASTTPAWQSTVEPTVDATKHVNGGCRAQNAAGTEWECYIGEAAVKQQIISQGFLGQYAPSPGVG